MAARAPGLDCEAFQAHWRFEHAGLAGQLPGLRSYVQNHAILEHGRPLLPYPGFDACSELQFDDLAAMDAAFSSELYRSAVVADEHSLIDKSRFVFLLSERRVLDDGDPGDGVKLLTLLRTCPGSTAERLRDVLGGPYREAVATARPLRHEQLLELPGAHEGRRPAACDAIDLLWFRTPEQALEFLRSAESDRAGLELAGVAFGTERLLTRTIGVV